MDADKDWTWRRCLAVIAATAVVYGLIALPLALGPSTLLNTDMLGLVFAMGLVLMEAAALLLGLLLFYGLFWWVSRRIGGSAQEKPKRNFAVGAMVLAVAMLALHF